MKKVLSILVTHTICGLAGFVLATTILANQDKQSVVSLKELGVAISPDTYYTDGKLTAPQSGGLTNYEIAPPNSQLKLMEAGADANDEDGVTDTWIVSGMNGLAPPEIDAPLGFVGMYFDNDGDRTPDKMSMTVGTKEYQYHVRRYTAKPNSKDKNRGSFSVYRAGQSLTVYYDFDKDGFVDLVSERDGIDLDQEDPDLAANQWVVWERRMHAVKRKHKATDGMIFEIEDSDGSTRYVRLSESVWKETNLE